MKRKAPIFAFCVALELVSTVTGHGMYTTVGASNYLPQAAPLNTTSSRPSLLASRAPNLASFQIMSFAFVPFNSECTAMQLPPFNNLSCCQLPS